MTARPGVWTRLRCSHYCSVRRRRSAKAAIPASSVVAANIARGASTGAGAGGTAHVPFRPGRLQSAPDASHAVLQHTPSMQKPDWHSGELVQLPPLGRVGTHVPMTPPSHLPAETKRPGVSGPVAQVTASVAMQMSMGADWSSGVMVSAQQPVGTQAIGASLVDHHREIAPTPGPVPGLRPVADCVLCGHHEEGGTGCP